MKLIPVASILLALCMGAVAEKSKNPSDYPVSARVLSKQFVHTSEYNQYTVEFGIGDLVYTSSGVGIHDICKEAHVKADYPAQVDGKHLRLLIGDKVCTYKVTGTRTN